MKNLSKEAERRDAAEDLRKLTKIIIDDMQQGLQNRLMDPKEMRLLGATAIRSIHLYLKTLDEGSKRQDQAIDASLPVRTIGREDQNKAEQE